MRDPKLSIVIPMVDEAATIQHCLSALQALRAADVEVIVCDGGSSDDSVALAAGLCDQLVHAPRGRGAQMNAGAQRARGEALLFLHADCRLPPEADRLVACALKDADWGRFDIAIEGRPALLRWVARLMNLRSRLTGIATGDQGIFVRRTLFESVGGFPDIALMEDIELSARLRRRAAPATPRATVTTSGRRWQQSGVLRTIVLMWSLRLRFALGADPDRLARRYGYRPRAR